MKKTLDNITGAIFSCNDCGEEWQAVSTAKHFARKHALETGHHVRGEIIRAIHYN